MASSTTYDEKLLSQAPEVTKADLQDGYNADLLREPTVKRTSTTRAAPLRSNSGALQQQYHSHDQDLESSAVPLQPKEGVKYVEPRKPWWQTVKGIVIIAVVAIVIILVAVLGGVLGSRNKSNSSERGDATQGSAGSSVPSLPPSSTLRVSSQPSGSAAPNNTQGAANDSNGSNSNGAINSNGPTSGGVNQRPTSDGPVAESTPVTTSGSNNGPVGRRSW